MKSTSRLRVETSKRITTATMLITRFALIQSFMKVLLMPGQWNDPFDSFWLKLITLLVYSIELVESVIMMAFVVYETKGLAGHYRTLINQLLSHLYGGVSICESLQ